MDPHRHSDRPRLSPRASCRCSTAVVIVQGEGCVQAEETNLSHQAHALSRHCCPQREEQHPACDRRPQRPRQRWVRPVSQLLSHVAEPKTFDATVYALDGIRSMINRKMAEHDARSGYPIASSRRKAKDKAVPSAASAVPANEPPPPSYEEVQASTSRQPLAPRRQSSFVRQLPTNPQPGLIRRRPSAPLLEVTGDKRLRTVRSRDRLGHRSPTHATFPHRQAGSQRRHRRTGSNSASESQRPYSGATTPADAGMDGGECAEDESEGETQRQRKLPRAANTGRSRHEGEDYTADLATFFRDPFKDSDDRNWTPVHKPQLSSPNGGPFRASSPASRSSLLSPASNIGASSSSRSSPAASAEEGSLQARDPRSGERATAQDLIAFLREEQPPTGTRASLQEPRRLSPTPEESSPRARASKRWSMNNVGSIFRPGSSSPRQSPTENARTPPESRENRDNRLDSGMSPRAPATTAALAASRPVPRLSEPPLKRARSEAPLEGAPDPNIPAETHPANLQNPLEYVKLARTKGARLMKAVESKKRTYLAVLCGEKGDRVELFSGARNISLALNRTFILPQSPRRLEFQLQGDDLADIVSPATLAQRRSCAEIEFVFLTVSRICFEHLCA